MGKVLAICISEKRGTQKSRVEAAEFVEDWGIKNDAHAGKWHSGSAFYLQNRLKISEIKALRF